MLAGCGSIWNTSSYCSFVYHRIICYTYSTTPEQLSWLWPQTFFFWNHVQNTNKRHKSHPSASWQPLCPNCCSCWFHRLMPQLLFQRHRGPKPFLRQEKEHKSVRISMLSDVRRLGFSLTGIHKQLWLEATAKCECIWHPHRQRGGIRISIAAFGNNMSP